MRCFSTLMPTRPVGRNSGKQPLGNPKTLVICLHCEDQQKNIKKTACGNCKAHHSINNFRWMQLQSLIAGGLFDELMNPPVLFFLQDGLLNAPELQRLTSELGVQELNM